MERDQLYYLGCKAIIQDKDSNILLLKNFKGYWDLPGGRIQEGELPFDALLREVKEETGLINLSNITQDAMVLTPIVITSADNSASFGLILWYYTCNLEATAFVNLSSEHVDFVWVQPDQVKTFISINKSIAPHIFKH